MSTAVERPATHERCGLSGNADCQLECALERKLADGVITGVGAVDHVVVADMQPVRLIEYAVPPRAQEPSIAIEDDQRMSTAMEHIHSISSVYRDGCDIAQRPPIRQFAPIAGYLIDEFAFPKPGCQEQHQRSLAVASVGVSATATLSMVSSKLLGFYLL